MICPSCRVKRHEECPEVARQKDKTLGKVQKACGQLCGCQHFVPAPPTEHDTDRIDC